jgi:hypothetical protein
LVGCPAADSLFFYGVRKVAHVILGFAFQQVFNNAFWFHFDALNTCPIALRREFPGELQPAPKAGEKCQ